LFDGDCPLLLLPEHYEMQAPARRIFLAWDDSSTALRAARLALPLLKQASSVYLAIVDPGKDSPDRSDPGGAFAQFLARHGVKCEVMVLARTDDSISRTLERRAQELGCDLMVMGAYGHSRLRQVLFGGTTRQMLENAALPVFLAH
jgi:nucleotide-binding universal stress UspA family protein